MELHKRRNADKQMQVVKLEMRENLEDKEIGRKRNRRDET